MRKLAVSVCIAGALLALGCATQQNIAKVGEPMYLTYELRGDVNLESVRYTNRYGITLAGHLFTPKNMDRSRKYHSRYYTEEAFEKAKEPKELIIIPRARHIDLYDREDVIPFDKLESFFKENLE